MNVRSVLLSSAMLLVLSCLAPDGTGRGLVRAESSPHDKVQVLVASYFPAVPPKKPGLCLGDEEVKLARLVNESRRSQGLPPIPVSRSLTMVAQAHVRDLQWNSPDMGTDPRGLNCNLHSWSDRGEWTPACYTKDHLYRTSMWRKPDEITQGVYNGNGYEIVFGGKGFHATAASALNGWQHNMPHNDVIVEHGPWSGYRWPAMGIGVYQGFAAVWFGKTADPLGTVPPCSE